MTKTIEIGKYPYLSIVVNKIDSISFRELEDMRSVVIISTGHLQHCINCETIDKGLIEYERILNEINR